MFATLRRSFRALSRRQALTYWVLVILRSLSGILDVAGMALVGVLAGLAANSGSGSTGFSVFGFTIPPVSQDTMVALVLGILVVFVFKAAFALTLSRVISRFIARLEAAEARKMGAVLLGGTLSEVKEYSTGEIQYALNPSIYSAFTGILNNVATLVSEGTLLLLIGAALIVFDPVSSAFVIVYFALVIVLIQALVGRRLIRAGRAIARGSIEVNTSVQDYLTSFREIFVFRKGEYFLEKFNEGRQRAAYANASQVFLSTLPRYTVETFLMLGVVAFVGWQFITGGLEDGIVIIGVFVTGGVRIMGSLIPLQTAFGSIKGHAGQAQLAHTIMDQMERLERTAVDAHPKPVTVDGAAPIGVDIADLSFVYPGSSEPALQDITIHINPGEHVAIVGPSGSGKTTLVDLILGLHHPTSGTIRIAGAEPIDLLTAEPGIISYVPQRPGLVTGTLRENIALGVPANEIDDERVRYAYTAAYLAELVDSLPEGVHTDVGAQVDSLSGGQIQRLGLARALYKHPRLLILDEATSALDASSEAFVAKSIAELEGEVTVITIAHRLSTIQHANQVFVLENSRLIGQGTFAELRRNNPLIAEYVELMSFDELPDEN